MGTLLSDIEDSQYLSHPVLLSPGVFIISSTAMRIQGLP